MTPKCAQRTVRTKRHYTHVITKSTLVCTTRSSGLSLLPQPQASVVSTEFNLFCPDSVRWQKTFLIHTVQSTLSFSSTWYFGICCCCIAIYIWHLVFGPWNLAQFSHWACGIWQFTFWLVFPNLLGDVQRPSFGSRYGRMSIVECYSSVNEN